MTKYESAEFEAALKQAFLDTVHEVGLETFLATSLFASNEAKSLQHAA